MAFVSYSKAPELKFRFQGEVSKPLSRWGSETCLALQIHPIKSPLIFCRYWHPWTINLNTTGWAERTRKTLFGHIFNKYSWHFFTLFYTIFSASDCTVTSLTAFEKKGKQIASFDPPPPPSSYLKWTQRTNFHHLITVRWKAKVYWEKKPRHTGQ